MASGIVASGLALGGLLVPLLTMLIDMFDWRTAMVIVGLGMWVIVLPLSLVVRHKPEQYGYQLDGEANITTVVHEGMVSLSITDVSTGVRQAIKSWAFWNISLVVTCQFLIINGVITHIMPYLSSIEIPRSTSSLIAGAIPLVSIGGRLGFGWLAYKFDKKHLMAGGFAIMSLGMLFFSYASYSMIWLLTLFIILFGIGWGGNVTMRVALLSEHFGRAKFGTIHGLVVGVVSLGQMVGAYLPGLVYDIWGSYQGIWLVFAGLAIVPLVIVLTLPRIDVTLQSSDKAGA